jgi:hypothetical protein
LSNQLKKPCHPEACFWPKDLAVAFGVGVDFFATKSRKNNTKNNSNPNREVLRPKTGLRMTTQLSS